MPTWFSLVRQLVSPQRDLFQPVVNVALDVGEVRSLSGTFRAKYAGQYVADVDMSRVVLPYQATKLSCKLQLMLVIDGVELLNIEQDIAANTQLCSFLVPTQVPINEEVAYTLTVVHPNSKLQNTFSPLKLRISHGTTK